MNSSRVSQNGSLSCLPVSVSWCWKSGGSLDQSVSEVVGTVLIAIRANGIYNDTRG